MHPFDVIVMPVMSEKAHLQAGSHNKYTFKVRPEANKLQVKDAIEKLYGVSVVNVNTINYLGKTKGATRRRGKRPDWKKAIVTLKAGDTIEALFDSV